MDSNGSGPSETLDIRKYSNRRYYDATHSRHVTLEDIHELIRSGHEVRVTDAKTGTDITGKVLAQIMLERDPPKLEVFPVPLLHRLIRANEQLVRDFVEKYFNRALSSFLQSQRQFEGYLRRMMGLSTDETAGVPMLDWTRAMFGPFVPPFWRGENAPKPEQRAREEAEQANQELRRLVQDLQEQVARLENQLREQHHKQHRKKGRPPTR
jgi:polyhydroxyalkanoate synthesis repressor PhaR